jgi:hypothetical protein
MLPLCTLEKGCAILKPSLEVLCVTLHEQSDNEAEQSKAAKISMVRILTNLTVSANRYRYAQWP